MSDPYNRFGNGGTPKIKELKAHAIEMAKLHRVPFFIENISPAAWHHTTPSGKLTVVRTCKISTRKSYAIAMHEIGHAVGPLQDVPRHEFFSVMYSEYGAWQWARENVIWWDTEMELEAQRCLRTYAKAEYLKMKRAEAFDQTDRLAQMQFVIPDHLHPVWKHLGWNGLWVDLYKNLKLDPERIK